MANKNIRRLPKVAIPDLSIDELEGISRQDVINTVKKLRGAMIDDNQ